MVQNYKPRDSEIVKRQYVGNKRIIPSCLLAKLLNGGSSQPLRFELIIMMMITDTIFLYTLQFPYISTNVINQFSFDLPKRNPAARCCQRIFLFYVVKRKCK